MPDSTAARTQRVPTRPPRETPTYQSKRWPLMSRPMGGSCAPSCVACVVAKRMSGPRGIEGLIEETPESDTPISDDQRELGQHPEAARQDGARRHGAACRHRGHRADNAARRGRAPDPGRGPFALSGLSRVLDDVIGMIHIKDVLVYWGTSRNSTCATYAPRRVSWRRLCRCSTCCSTCALAHAHGRWWSTSSAAATGC